jgi:hypothetical protein
MDLLEERCLVQTISDPASSEPDKMAALEKLHEAISEGHCLSAAAVTTLERFCPDPNAPEQIWHAKNGPFNFETRFILMFNAMVNSSGTTEFARRLGTWIADHKRHVAAKTEVAQLRLAFGK